MPVNAACTTVHDNNLTTPGSSHPQALVSLQLSVQDHPCSTQRPASNVDLPTNSNVPHRLSCSLHQRVHIDWLDLCPQGVVLPVIAPLQLEQEPRFVDSEAGPAGDGGIPPAM